ncbi:MAG: hypothetical protein LBN28_01510 [Desulfovibrio sp.]|nr:hypothetical protein [Desulfovibrio sp.]
MTKADQETMLPFQGQKKRVKQRVYIVVQHFHPRLDVHKKPIFAMLKKYLEQQQKDIKLPDTSAHKGYFLDICGLVSKTN